MISRHPSLRGLAAACLLACTTVACSKARPADDGAPAPDDFALSITVDEAGPGGAAWYVVDPDGALRVATGARLDRSPVPPLVRQLSAAHVDRLWSVTRTSGLEAAVRSSPAVDEGRPRRGVTVFLAADHARRAAALPADDPRVVLAVTELRRLAWMDPIPAKQP